MAIEVDFSVAVNGDIRHDSGTTNYTVLELHRFLQDLADDSQATGDDLVDITSDTPSDRSTDNIITLLGSYNIDDDAAEYLYAGSITQNSGDIVYSGLQVLGAVNNSATQLMIVQDNNYYQFTTTPASPFWGTQSGGGYNGNSAAGILMRCLVKSRDNGADIDGKAIRVQARHWGDTYDFFNVALGQGESVAAVGTTPDAQNDTTQGTVTTYSHVTNAEGYQLIDLNNGAGNQPYYAKWTYGADTSSDGLKGVWEFIKDLSGNGSVKTIHGMTGEFFLGVTHDIDYIGASGTLQEDEILAWGTKIYYDTLVSGPFTPGNYVTIGSNGAAGRVLYDEGTDELLVALEDTSITLLNSDVITEFSGPGMAVTSTAAQINTGISAIEDNDKSGGSGKLLADDTSDTIWIQLLTGVAPVDTLVLFGTTTTDSVIVDTAPTSKTIPKIFLGSYTGTLIGAFGIGVDSGDLTASDTIEDLLGVVQTPPNNVTFSVTGLNTLTGGDRVLVGPRLAGVLDKSQLTLNTTLAGGAETSIVVGASSITDNTPATGNIRVELDTGVYRLETYTANDGDNTFTIASSSWVDPADATSANDVFLSYIDKNATAATESYTTIYTSSQDLFVRVRFGDSSDPIKTFEAPATLGSGGGTIAAIRQADA